MHDSLKTKNGDKPKLVQKTNSPFTITTYTNSIAVKQEKEDYLEIDNPSHYNERRGIEEDKNGSLQSDEISHHANSLDVPNNLYQESPDKNLIVDIPNLTNDPGPYDFSVTLEDRDDSMKSPSWLTSSITKKLYTHMNKAVPFHIHLSKDFPKEGMSVRVMAVFNNHQYLRNLVHRCPNHSNPSDPTNIDFPHVEHVIRVDHPSAVYEKSQFGRMSVTLPLQLTYDGSLSNTPIRLRFMCLGSCVGGLNRRPLAVLISLEHNGKDVGRQIIDVRVCACPTRDIRMDESGSLRKWKRGKRQLLRTETEIESVEPCNKFPRRPNMQLSSSCGIAETFLLPVRGHKLFEFLKNIKKMYLSVHPEYARNYPDVHIDDLNIVLNETPREGSWSPDDAHDAANVEEPYSPDANLVISESPPPTRPQKPQKEVVSTSVQTSSFVVKVPHSHAQPNLFQLSSVPLAINEGVVKLVNNQAGKDGDPKHLLSLSLASVEPGVTHANGFPVGIRSAFPNGRIVAKVKAEREDVKPVSVNIVDGFHPPGNSKKLRDRKIEMAATVVKKNVVASNLASSQVYTKIVKGQPDDCVATMPAASKTTEEELLAANVLTNLRNT